MLLRLAYLGVTNALAMLAPPIWKATAASALAHMLATSGSDPVAIPDHQVARSSDQLSTASSARAVRGQERTLVLAGPGIPHTDGDLALIPEHPQTGKLWPVTPPMTPVPLAWDAWRHLAAELRAPRARS